MKKIKRNELFRSVSAFLAERGVELKDGSLTGTIRKGCDMLTEAVNLAQGGLAKAKAGVGAKVDQIRQAVHEKTAPQPKSGPSTPPKPPGARTRSAKKPAAAPKPSRRRGPAAPG
jgi:hypothetical protein